MFHRTTGKIMCAMRAHDPFPMPFREFNYVWFYNYYSKNTVYNVYMNEAPTT